MFVAKSDPEQRAFTQRLSKQHAKEVRQNVATQKILPKSEITAICPSPACLQIDLIIDYEEFLQQHAVLISRDPLRAILDFPLNDLSIKKISKKIRTVSHVLPKEELALLPLYIQQCVNCFIRPWTIVEFSHRKYSGSSLGQQGPRCDKYMISQLDQQEYEIDSDYTSFDDTLIYQSDSCTISSRQSIASISSMCTSTDTLTPRESWASFDLRSSANDPLIPGLLDRRSTETLDQTNEIQRAYERQSAIFHLYTTNDDAEDVVEHRAMTEIPVEHVGNKILVKIVQLKLDLEVEPLFASMAIYDAKERKKLSENFYFDMNSEALKRMLSSHVPYSDISTQSRTAIFEVSHPSQDLYLVIRLEKVLQGDIKDSVEPYIKEDKDKYRDKAKSNAADFCERLGKYRMPFAWTGICLTSIFNEESAGDKEDRDRDSQGTASSSNSLDRKSSTSSFDQLKRRATEVGNFTRRGSLERREKRRSWSHDDFTQTLGNFKAKTINLPHFLKQEGDKMKDDDLFKVLPDLNRPSTLARKFKVIPGCLVFEISPAPTAAAAAAAEVSCALTPELERLHPYLDERQRPIKEILEFPASPNLFPNYSYRNLLFINFRELNFSSRTGSSRNLAVRVQLMAGEKQSDALKAVFAKSSCPEYATEAFSCVNYHNKSPSFYDEVKVALPGNLMQNHHLLFTVFHISCQRKFQELPTSIETPVGFTWLPILQDDKLCVGEFNLPVMVEEPPENYSFIPPDVQLPGTKWLDNHRPVFSVSVEAHSTVHTLNPYLDKFIVLCEYLASRKVPPRIGEGNMEREMRKALREIHLSDCEPLIKHLPVIMDKLLELMVTTYKVGGETLTMESTVFMTLCQISKKLSLVDDLFLEENGRVSILSTYVQYQASIPHPLESQANRAASDDATPEATQPAVSIDGQVRLLHEQLAYQWVSASNEPTIDLTTSNSWFLFELIVKSMIEYLDRAQLIDSPRKGRFSHQLTHDITNLVEIIARKVVIMHNYTDSGRSAQSLNSSLGFFIFDLLSIMDRGFVFGLIKSYYIALKPTIAIATDIIHYKLDFLRIVCSHEHFVALNLPFATPFTSSSAPCSPSPSINSNNSQYSLKNAENALFAELSPEFRQQHFLMGLVLSELAIVLDTRNAALHDKSIRFIRNLMIWHDSDPRFVDAEAKARLAALYLPLLSIVMDTIPQLHQFLNDSHAWIQSIGVLDDYQGPHVTVRGSPTINPEVAYAISGSRLYSFPSEPPKTKLVLSGESTRHLLLCFVWVLKNLEKSTLYRWMVGLVPHRVHKLLQVLNTCLPCFEYTGKQRRRQPVSRSTTTGNSFRKATDIERLEDCIRGRDSARNDLINRRKDKNSTEKLRWRKDHMPYRSQFYEVKCDQTDVKTKTNCHIEGNLATEVTMVVLDSLELIVQVATVSELHHNLLGVILKVMLHALSRNQSSLALQNLFSSQRSLIFKFHNLLFDEESDSCADLCLLLLKHCGSQLPLIRSQAAASLYLLMRQNFEIGNNFARVKLQVTMSLSSLVGTSSAFSEQSLRKALKTILVYAESDAELQNSSFPEQVRDLLFNLHMILSDTVKMKEYQEDPEMLLDLMHRIAKGYQNSPDLRLTWLENMAKKHMERSNHTEAAMCFVHSAALVAEYLHMLEAKTHLPVGAVSFKAISPNCLRESAVSDDVLRTGEDGICLGTRFTVTGLKALLEEAANSFQIAGMYEPMNDVYKVLIPICETNREFHKLAKIHGKLQEAFNRVSQFHGKRMFGTYFRVGFYGTKFGDLNKQEFIYKEPTLTKLPEIFNRLQNFYSDRFGPEYIEIIKDSNHVDASKLADDKTYIQITYVEPYFETYELRHRETHFERNFNLRTFIFATPFTKTGKAHGELHEQWKKKTILTTDTHFPYVKTRIQVVERRQIVLEPIEVAIEDIQKKTMELTAATTQDPPDMKNLQMVLQGCIGTTVNQGPMEMATVFLSVFANGHTSAPSKHQNKLRLCFKDFSKKCFDALNKNKTLIGHDQRDYQKELENNYKKFVEELQPLIKITPIQIRSAIK